MLTAKQIWPILQVFMPKDKWMTPMEIYEVVRGHAELDSRDLEPIDSSTTVPNPQLRWGSNVRGVLRTRFKSGELEWDQQGKYLFSSRPIPKRASPAKLDEQLNFVPGHEYRRIELHQRFKGNPRSGISTPAESSVIMLFTGASGEQHGYSDGWTSEHTFDYYGEGQTGDQEFKRGNLAVRDHVVTSKSLLMFEATRKAHVKFLGEMTCVGYRIVSAPDTAGNIRNAIVFELLITESLTGDRFPDGQEEFTLPTGIKELLTAALEDSADTRSKETRVISTRRRSEAVKRYARVRAEGTCEGCKSPAPFTTRDGRPYLEVHHVHRLSDGGPDRPDAVIAICPNCHRRVHHGEDGKSFNEELIRRALEAHIRVERMQLSPSR